MSDCSQGFEHRGSHFLDDIVTMVITSMVEGTRRFGVGSAGCDRGTKLGGSKSSPRPAENSQGLPRKERLAVGRSLRAIVVDDNQSMLKSASRLLANLPIVELVGQATSGHEALEVVEKLQPDLVLMDLSMPGMDGLEATRRLTVQANAPKVIIMSVHDMPEYRDAAMAAGAHSFVSKSSLVDQLSTLIHEVLQSLNGERGRAGHS